MSSMPQICLKSAIAQMDARPPLPVIAQKLMALDLDTDHGERQVLSLIDQDPQIAARIVGLANSPLFGMPKRVTSVSDAAMLMGFAV